jgi:nucleoside-diphosphate-sugar epimerase
MAGLTAIVYGSTGLIGKELVSLLIQSEVYENIILPVRKVQQCFASPKIREMVVNFDNLSEYKENLKADITFLCLGTTMAKAKSKEAFYKVDFTYSAEAAKLACENGSSHILLVSSLGADTKSMVQVFPAKKFLFSDLPFYWETEQKKDSEKLWPFGFSDRFPFCLLVLYVCTKVLKLMMLPKLWYIKVCFRRPPKGKYSFLIRYSR